MSDLNFRDKIVDIVRGRGSISIKDKYDQIPYYSPLVCIKSFEKYLDNSEVISQRKIRDLVLMDLVSEDGETVYSEDNIQKRIVEEAKKNNPINQTYTLLKSLGKLKSNDVVDKLGSTLDSYKSDTSKRQVASVLLSWANFLLIYEKDGNVTVSFANKKRNLGAYFLSFGPNYIIDIIIDIDNNADILDKRKVNDMIFLGLLTEIGNNFELTENALKILNAVEPELALSNFIENNTHIQEFKSVYENCSERKLLDLMKNKRVKEFFNGYSESSIKTKLSIYQGWLKYQRKNSSLQQFV